MSMKQSGSGNKSRALMPQTQASVTAAAVAAAAGQSYPLNF